MTRQERDHLRHLIDTEKRRRLQRAEVRFQREKQDPRNPYWKTYYWRNRDKILARREARKQAAA